MCRRGLGYLVFKIGIWSGGRWSDCLLGVVHRLTVEDVAHPVACSVDECYDCKDGYDARNECRLHTFHDRLCLPKFFRVLSDK